MEREREPFVVDLSDPDDIRVKRDRALVKLKEAQALLERMQEIKRDASDWRTTAEFLTLKLGEPIERHGASHVSDSGGMASSGHGSGEAHASTAALAAEVVNRENRKIRALDVFKILAGEGHDVTKPAVSNALYYAANRAKSIKAAEGRGMYAPLTYVEPERADVNLGLGDHYAGSTDAAA